MSIVRVSKNNNFVVMNRTALNDSKLSWKAKGIMAYLLSMPDDWTFYMEELQTHATDGKTSFQSGFKELKEHGYVTRRPVREGQRIVRWETIVHEVPQKEDSLLTDFQEVENLQVENQKVDFQEVENQPLLNTDNNQVLNKPNTNHQPNNLIKQNKTSTRDPGWGQVVNFYHTNIHPTPSPIVYEKLGMMYDLYPIAELVLEALQIAVLNHAKNHIHYAEPILLRWRSQNIKTVEQARFEQRKDGQQHASNRGKSISTTTDAEERLRRETERLKKFL